MIPLLATGLILAAASILITLWPLLELKPGGYKPKDILRELERLLFERERLLSNLKDLELDRQMKKISGEDYEDLKNQLMSEAGGIYSALDRVEKETLVLKQIDRDLLELEKEIR